MSKRILTRIGQNDQNVTANQRKELGGNLSVIDIYGNRPREQGSGYAVIIADDNMFEGL
jgi:hypothetical protein